MFFLEVLLYFCSMKKLFFICFIVVSYAMGQETVESIRRQIKAVEAEATKEVKLHNEEKKRHADFIEVGRKKVVALNSQNQSLKVEMDSMRTELSRLKDARQKALSVSRFYENKRIKYQESLALAIDSLQYLFKSDFPYKNEEAMTSISEIASQLKKGHISSADALARTVEVFLDRIRMGYSTEVWKGSLVINSQTIHGTYMRYGTVASIFVSLDGQSVFWLAQSPEKEYVWRDVSENMEMRSMLKDALKVAEGKTAPKIVPVPVYLRRGDL